MESLKGQVRLHANALLNTRTARQAIASDASPNAHAFQERLEKQQAHNQQSLYRACAGITTFRVRDPDPNAVDAGSVLGIRVEVMTRARFIRPYFVFLNRPYSGSETRRRFLRVHRSTVPSCIPLSGLAARYLPAPRPPAREDAENVGEQQPERQQDLSRFVRSLRREIVRYHNRVALIADLRRALGLDGKKRDAKELAEASSILSVSPADAEAKQVGVEWKDGRSGRLIIGDDGDVVKLVVTGERGRDRELARGLLDGTSRLEEVARKLSAM